MGTRGLTPYAEQAKERADSIEASLQQKIQHAHDMISKTSGSARWVTDLESAQEDLRRFRSLVEEISVPIEESGMKKTPYMIRQRELGKRILEYNRNSRKYTAADF